jgi:uncharacterized protein YchJ
MIKIQHRPIMHLLIVTASLVVSGCSWMPDFMKPAETTPAVTAYNAERAPERMEQFVNPANGNRVYRYCVGSECPEPTPKKPLVSRLPVVTEISADGRIALPAPATARPVVAPPAISQAAIATPRKQIALAPEKAVVKADVSPAESAEPALPAGSVAEFVTTWATLWVEKDTDAYFALYADTFTPANSEKRTSWKQDRAEKIRRAKNLSVKVDELKITENSDQATVLFYQSFNSTRLNSRIRKRLDLVKIDGQWKIVREAVLPIAAAT